MSIIPRYQEALTAQEIHHNPSQEAAVRVLDQALREYQESRGTRQGVYLWGEVGRGKTALMDMFFASLPSDRKQRLHFQEFMQYVHAELHRLQGHINPLQEIAVHLATQIEILCLDELLVEDVADAMILGTLLQALLAQKLFLVITSNPAPDALYAKGWQREKFLPAIAILKQYLYVLEVKSESDYRRKPAITHNTYFFPDTAETDQQLKEIFEQYAHPPVTYNTALDVNAHILFTRQVSSHVMWCDFEALCGQPHSAQDYLILAKRFKIILLSHIPVLDESRENESRRFISFVDACYDRRIHLFMSAAVPLTELYQGRQLQHAFPRTISRLWEMQTAQYQR